VGACSFLFFLIVYSLFFTALDALPCPAPALLLTLGSPPEEGGENKKQKPWY
jgi:hypothetical protein